MNLSKCVRVVLSCLCVLPFTTEASWHECCCPNFDYSYNPPLLEPAPCGKFFVEGEVFVWRTHVDNLTPGWVDTISFDETTTDFTTNALKVNERDLSYDWDWGFRVGVGFDAACDHWGARAVYTYYHSKSDDHLHLENNVAGINSGFTNFFLKFPTEVLIQGQGAIGFDSIDVRSCYKVELHQVDLDLSREYFVGCFLSIRPVLGLRYFCVDQKFNVHERNQLALDVTSPDLIVQVDVDVHSKVHYEGVGIKAGFNTNWEIGCGFGIFGDAFLTTAYGDFNIKNRVGLTPELDGSPLDGFDFDGGEGNHDFCAVKPIIDYTIGLYWRQGFNCDKSLFEVRLGWENHIYGFQNQFRGIRVGSFQEFGAGLLAPSTDTRCGDLTFCGFSLMAGIWF